MKTPLKGHDYFWFDFGRHRLELSNCIPTARTQLYKCQNGHDFLLYYRLVCFLLFIIQIPLKTFSHCNHLHRRNLVLVSHQSRLWGPRGRAGELFVHVCTFVKFIFVCYLNFRGSYGYSVWMVWIGGGCFLPAAALAFEGGFINEKGFNYAELMGWVNSWALLFILCFNKHLAIIKVIPVIREDRSTSVRG